MVVPSVFELNSIKEQLALLSALSAHIDFEREDMEEDLKRMLTKMDNSAKNLQNKYENLKKLLDN